MAVAKNNSVKIFFISVLINPVAKVHISLQPHNPYLLGLFTRDKGRRTQRVGSGVYLKRNPCVFRGRLITVTRRDDGSLRPNFKPLHVDKDFTVDGYALEVAGEIREALKGLVGE